MEKKRWIIQSDQCVMCGAPVPEGRQVCPMCEAKVTHAWEGLPDQNTRDKNRKPTMET